MVWSLVSRFTRNEINQLLLRSCSKNFLSSFPVNERLEISSLKSKHHDYYLPVSRMPTENHMLFTIINQSISNQQNASSELTNNRVYRSLLESVDSQLESKSFTKNDLMNYQKKMLKLVEEGNNDCLFKLKLLIKDYSLKLTQLSKPRKEHYYFIKKLEENFIIHLKKIGQDFWTSKKNIHDSIELFLLFYKCFPPATITYCQKLIENILGQYTDLSIDQFLCLMFCCVLSRKRLTSFQIDWCQNFIHQNLNSINLDQLSLILVAFHKTQSHLNSELLLQDMVTKISQEAPKQANSTLRSSLLKGINYSLVIPGRESSKNLIDTFLSLDSLSLYNYIHLCEYSVAKKIYHPKLIDKVLDLFEKHIEHLREKDIDRILKCATFYDHLQPPCPSIYKSVMELDRRIGENGSHHLYTIPAILKSTLILGIYPPNMINCVMNQNWMNHVHFSHENKHIFYWSLMTIRDCLMIERYPEYHGKLNLLDTLFRNGSSKAELRVQVSTVLGARKLKQSLNLMNLESITQAAINAFPGRMVQLGYLLSTSWTPDLIITRNPKHIRLLKSTIRTPNCFAKSYVIVYQGKQMFADQRSFCQLTGHYRLRERLFKKLGLTVINIPFYDLYHKNDLSTGDFSDLVEYLRKKINAYEA